MKLVAHDICKSYEENDVLENVNLEVSGGEMLAITGPSGRGKSTLLSILGLLLDPTSGTVELDGKNLLELNEKGKAHIRNSVFGYLFQDTKLVSSLRALENVLVPAQLGSHGDCTERARELMCRFGLEDRMQHFPHQLSIGQKRRASLARALLLEPDVVFADEPTNDLDEENAEVVKTALTDYAKSGKTVIVVTHDATLVELADQVIRL